MEQRAYLVVPALGCPPLRGRIELGIPDSRIGAVSHKKRDCIFMTVNRRPVQARPAEDPFCIDVGAAPEQSRRDRRVAQLPETRAATRSIPFAPRARSRS